ncbi:MAG: hypothetical protein ACLSDM_09285 [Butyricicoccus sp.]
MKAKSNGADAAGCHPDRHRATTHEARLRGYRSAVEQAGALCSRCSTATRLTVQPRREAAAQKYPQCGRAARYQRHMALAATGASGITTAPLSKTVICGFDGNQAAVEAPRPRRADCRYYSAGL